MPNPPGTAGHGVLHPNSPALQCGRQTLGPAQLVGIAAGVVALLDPWRAFCFGRNAGAERWMFSVPGRSLDVNNGNKPAPAH